MTKVLFWVPLVVCTYMALAPQPPAVVAGVPDVFLHAFAFAYLTFALWLAHFTARRGRGARAGSLVALWMLAYGIALEGAQSFLPARTAEAKDLVVDAAGIGVGLAAFWLTSAFRARLAAGAR